MAYAFISLQAQIIAKAPQIRHERTQDISGCESTGLVSCNVLVLVLSFVYLDT